MCSWLSHVLTISSMSRDPDMQCFKKYIQHPDEHLMLALLKAGDIALRTSFHFSVFRSVKIECILPSLHSYHADTEQSLLVWQVAICLFKSIESLSAGPEQICRDLYVSYPELIKQLVAALSHMQQYTMTCSILCLTHSLQGSP